MKRKTSNRRQGGHPDRRLEGAALVIVLAFLVIITGLVVAFLSSVTNEATATAASAAGVTTRSLADAAIQLDIAQIRDATAGFAHGSDGTLQSNSPLCWASQPGAIRTYDTNANGGSTNGGVSIGGGGAIYKLYSSTNMVDTTGGNPTNDLPTSSSWVSNPALFTDLNSPVVTVVSGVTNTNYPILDPYMTNLVTGGSGGGRGASVGSGQPIVDGFAINTSAPSIAGVSNPAAMPVQWIYQLKNGTLTVPSSVSGNIASFTSNAPSQTNPIVGRIAFWTDDESCKLNLNTASEGSFWGTPSFATLMDSTMALTPPVANEFNRFPGHPASTCLSPVLWSYMGITNPGTYLGPIPGNPGNAYSLTNTTNSGNSFGPTAATNYYTNLFSNVTPRYAWGGSYAGSISNTLSGNSAIPYTNLPTSRLYSSVDEFFFSATNATLTNRIISTTTNNVGLTPLQVSQLKFFLTTESRAPEVNPLNLPKITMWPEPDTNHTMTANTNSPGGSSNRTIADQTIAFCSTLGTNAYYFTRYDATDPSHDFSAATTPRNVQVYNYLRNQLNQPIPGYKGGAFTSTKWGAKQADQICTEIFDYIRSCINLVDSSSVTNPASFTTFSTTSYPFAYTAPPVNQTFTNTNNNWNAVYNVASLTNGSAQVIPITISNPDGTTTKGIGRFPTVRAGTLWIIARSADQPPLMCHPDRRPIVYDGSGNQLSTNVGGVSSIKDWASLTTVLSGNAYAMVNPLHPWTCPVTNPVINGHIMVPQLLATNSGTQYAVMADTNASVVNSSATPYKIDTNNDAPPSSWFTNVPTNIYPIFNLITNNGGVTGRTQTNPLSTRTYPSYAINGSNSAFLYVTPNSSLTAPGATNSIQYGYKTNFPVPNTFKSTNTLYSWAVAVASNTVTYGSINPTGAYKGLTNGTNITGWTNVTHAGLPYLTIQDTTNYAGAFDLKNSNLTNGPDTAYYTTAMPPHITRAEALFLPELVNVAPGQVGLGVNFQITVAGLDSFACNTTPMGFPGSNNASMKVFTSAGPIGVWTGHEDRYGIGWEKTAFRYPIKVSDIDGSRTPCYSGPFLITNTAADPSTGLNNSGTFNFTGNTNLQILLQTTNASPTTIQTVHMNFPGAIFPAPKLPAYNASEDLFTGASFYPPVAAANASYNTTNSNTNGTYVSTTYNVHNDIVPPNALTFTNTTGGMRWNCNCIGNSEMGTRWLYPDMAFSSSSGISTNWNPPQSTLGAFGADTIVSVEALYGDTRLISSLSNVPSSFFTANPYYGYSSQLTNTGWPCYYRNAYSFRNAGSLGPGDVLGFLVPSDATGMINSTNPLASWLRTNTEIQIFLLTNTPPGVTATNVIGTINIFGSSSMGGGYDTSMTTIAETTPTCDFANATFRGIWTKGGDYDNGSGGSPDGPFINKVDEGYGATTFGVVGSAPLVMLPYYNWGSVPGGYATMSANREVASPVLFGSLPVFDTNWDPSSPLSTMTNSSWRTLQFSPNPNALSTNTLASRNSAAGYNEPDGLITNATIPDHLLLDFFAMPVVQPYPISDPFSTAGKVNMNYQIVPFSYINRDAAMRGLLKSVLITAVPESAGGDYKNTGLGSFANTCATNGNNFYFHYPINPNDTLAQFTNRFSQNDLFHSPSEICSVWLYPAQQPTTANGFVATNPLSSITYTPGNANIKGWWYNSPGVGRMGLTGDNIRERPYNYLYPRLTTKSNTYRIHYWVQTLKQTPTAHPTAGSWNTWIDPGSGSGISDKITGDLRGSAVIERYIDPSRTDIPDFTTNVSSSSISGAPMDSYYQFRVFNAKQFTP